MTLVDWAARRDLLAAPHVAPLQRVVADLRRRHAVVPDPDPLDGGAEARLLLLLEAPGPRNRESGFISRDHQTGTGRNLRDMLARAGIERSDTLIWNAVPWIIHEPGAPNRAPRRPEIRAGLAELPPVLAALPQLAVCVLAGRIAAEAEPLIRASRPSLPILRMPHPSPTIQCTAPAIPVRCRMVLAEAAGLLQASRVPA